MALAVWPSMVVFATLAASEHPFLPFYVTACSLRWFRNWKWVLVCGVAAGLAALIRPQRADDSGIWLAGGVFEELSDR